MFTVGISAPSEVRIDRAEVTSGAVSSPKRPWRQALPGESSASLCPASSLQSGGEPINVGTKEPGVPSVLKHTECSACGHRHHFCFAGDDLNAGQECEYLCPETSRKARLRPQAAPEIFRFSPQGAVVLQRVGHPAVQTAPAAAEIEGEGDGTMRMQLILPQLKDLAAKVGDLEQLSRIVETLKRAREQSRRTEYM